jgi:hypothetical protein
MLGVIGNSGLYKHQTVGDEDLARRLTMAYDVMTLPVVQVKLACPQCHGKKEVWQTCPRCGDTGEIHGLSCPKCDGVGAIPIPCSCSR